MDQGSSSTQTPAPELAAVAAGTGPVRAMQPRGQARSKSLSVKFKDYGGSFLFVVPYLAFFLVFLLGPLVYAFYVSLHNWTTIGGNQGFVGFLHYYNLLFNTSGLSFQDFWEVGMAHTLLFVVISVPLLVVFALTLALLLANAPWRSFFRSVFYVPAVLSVTVACTIWLWVFQNGGILNEYLHVNTPWLQLSGWAWFAIIVATMWWTVGFNMVVLLAGIVDIPNDYYEASTIDGANTWQRIWYITIPILRPILAFVTITQMIASFGVFGQPYLITGGGPNRATETVVITILNRAFGSYQDLATASAMSFVMGVIMIILAVAQIRIFRVGEI